MDIKDSFQLLKHNITKERFKGYDPYDGLNSRIFQATPLKHWDLARLAWIQAFKRNPVNLRKLLLVPKEYNAKGIGLLLTAYCNLYQLAQKGETSLGCKEEHLYQIHKLADILIELQAEGYSGSCWGYNFDWQARRLFHFPKNTPTIVATSFCASALFLAYECTGVKEYLETALSSSRFILKDLNRTEKQRGFLFSYSPIKGNDTVYNASLLGSKLLSQCYKYSPDPEFLDAAYLSILACTDAQGADGSWCYGELPVQNWIDSFHTGYNLEAIHTYQAITKDSSFDSHIAKGFDFYIKNFFEKDGTPKYYHNQTYPIDIHCPAQLFVTLHHLRKHSEQSELASRVMNWTIKNMQHPKGYFYYQMKKRFSSKISYMRWSNAFMFYAMSFFLIDSYEVSIHQRS